MDDVQMSRSTRMMYKYLVSSRMMYKCLVSPRMYKWLVSSRMIDKWLVSTRMMYRCLGIKSMKPGPSEERKPQQLTVRLEDTWKVSGEGLVSGEGTFGGTRQWENHHGKNTVHMWRQSDRKLGVVLWRNSVPEHSLLTQASTRPVWGQGSSDFTMTLLALPLTGSTSSSTSVLTTRLPHGPFRTSVNIAAHEKVLDIIRPGSRKSSHTVTAGHRHNVEVRQLGTGRVWKN